MSLLLALTGGGGGNNQSLAITLDSITALANQTLVHSQSMAITLDDVAVSINQVLTHSQTLAIVLDGVTVAGSQTLVHSQSLSATLDSVTALVSQNLRHEQSLSITLDSIGATINQTVAAASKAQSLNIGLDDLTFVTNQINESSSAIAAGGYDYPSKKYIIRKNGKLLVFKNKRDALNLITQDDVTSELNVLIDIDVAEKQYNAPSFAKIAPLPAFKPAYDIDAMLQALQSNLQAKQLLQARQYQALLALYEQFIDDEEIELLLMAA